MILFGPIFVKLLIIGSLILTGAAAVILLVLVMGDLKNRKIW
ncbi:MAG: hypothetical protein WD490_03640 [Opitutales bacterium]